MSVKFEIEFKLKMGKKKNDYVLFTKCLEMDKDFFLSENSRLNGFKLKSYYINQPRAAYKDGNPRFDLFAFKIRYEKDFDQLEEGQIIELTP